MPICFEPARNLRLNESQLVLIKAATFVVEKIDMLLCQKVDRVYILKPISLENIPNHLLISQTCIIHYAYVKQFLFIWLILILLFLSVLFVSSLGAHARHILWIDYRLSSPMCFIFDVFVVRSNLLFILLRIRLFLLLFFILLNLNLI